MADRLFISHASADESVAERIVAYLEANGRPCWIASRDIPPQSIYAEAIAEGMQACSACLVILSEASNKSKAVKRELELASHYDKPFIPIRVDSTEPGRGFDYYLRNAQWLDYGRERERALDRIVAHVTGAPRPPPLAPARSAAEPPSYATYDTDAETPAKRGPGIAMWVGGAGVALAILIWGVSRFGEQTAEIENSGAVETTTGIAPADASTAQSIEDRASAERAERLAQLPRGVWLDRLRTERFASGQTMAGVRLGQPLSEVRATLGVPVREDDTTLIYGTDRLFLHVWDNSIVQDITLVDNDLELRGLSPTFNTIGIGSTRNEAIAALGNSYSEESSDTFPEGCLHYDGVRLDYYASSQRIFRIHFVQPGDHPACLG